jgi:hypothetical protein
MGGGGPEVCPVNSTNQKSGKTALKLAVHLNARDREKSNFKSLNKVTLMWCCLEWLRQDGSENVLLSSPLIMVTGVPFFLNFNCQLM